MGKNCGVSFGVMKCSRISDGRTIDGPLNCIPYKGDFYGM